jgi:hypothetical protein
MLPLYCLCLVVDRSTPSFVEPAERVVQRILTVAVASGILYGAAAYGPKAIKIYRILQDDASQLASVTTLLHM